MHSDEAYFRNRTPITEEQTIQCTPRAFHWHVRRFIKTINPSVHLHFCVSMEIIQLLQQRSPVFLSMRTLEKETTFFLPTPLTEILSTS